MHVYACVWRTTRFSSPWVGLVNGGASSLFLTILDKVAQSQVLAEIDALHGELHWWEDPSGDGARSSWGRASLSKNCLNNLDQWLVWLMENYNSLLFEHLENVSSGKAWTRTPRRCRCSIFSITAKIILEIFLLCRKLATIAQTAANLLLKWILDKCFVRFILGYTCLFVKLFEHLESGIKWVCFLITRKFLKSRPTLVRLFYNSKNQGHSLVDSSVWRERILAWLWLLK